MTHVVGSERGRTATYSKFRLQNVLISRIDSLVESDAYEIGLNFTQIELSYKQAQG